MSALPQHSLFAGSESITNKDILTNEPYGAVRFRTLSSLAFTRCFDWCQGREASPPRISHSHSLNFVDDSKLNPRLLQRLRPSAQTARLRSLCFIFWDR